MLTPTHRFSLAALVAAACLTPTFAAVPTETQPEPPATQAALQTPSPRGEALAGLLNEAVRLWHGGDLEAALAKAEEAVTMAPGDAGALALRSVLQDMIASAAEMAEGGSLPEGAELVRADDAAVPYRDWRRKGATDEDVDAVGDLGVGFAGDEIETTDRLMESSAAGDAPTASPPSAPSAPAAEAAPEDGLAVVSGAAPDAVAGLRAGTSRLEATGERDKAELKDERVREVRRSVSEAGGGEGEEMAEAPAGEESSAPVEAAGEATRGVPPGGVTEHAGSAPDIAPPPDEPTVRPTARTLTAGSVSDLEQGEAYHNMLAGLGDAEDPESLSHGFTAPNFLVHLRGRDDRPVRNATVILHTDAGTPLRVLVTGADGDVAVASRYDGIPDGGQVFATAIAEGSPPITVTLDPEVDATHTIHLPVAGAEAPLDVLDLALVIDTTGSMGDEMAYLKVELQSIVDRVNTAHPGVRQRWSLIAYRDTGDEYIVRTTDLTGSLAELSTLLGEQDANGGGDEPEAMDQALVASTELAWATGPAARVVFLVADAPPHSENESLALDAVNRLREQGVSVYPVASSGVRDRAEFIMRSAALLTGGRYVFLTDDSGVGGSHQAPKGGASYDVEPLSDLMVRIIDHELTGHPLVKAAEGDVIRKVE